MVELYKSKYDISPHEDFCQLREMVVDNSFIFAKIEKQLCVHHQLRTLSFDRRVNILVVKVSDYLLVMRIHVQFPSVYENFTLQERFKRDTIFFIN